ncbi:hypothetical protein ACE5IS_19415 [Leptospira wolffii]|uniref:HD domain-containing protein n=1 Tax=Leptospira wolffii TaxID=409998 RepID=A0ABV5BTQ3_9LEPT
MINFRNMLQSAGGYILHESTLEALESLYNFKKALDASDRLIKHHLIVLNTALKIVGGLPREVLPHFNIELLASGCSLHDAGKMIVTSELDHVGSTHEEIGRTLLILLGIPTIIANFCLSDEFDTMEKCISLLADTLWKGFRNYDIEDKLTELIADKMGWDFWDTFQILDGLFESIAKENFQIY